MSYWNPHYFPLAQLFLLALFVVLGFLIAFIEIGILQYAYEKIGVKRPAYRLNSSCPTM